MILGRAFAAQVEAMFAHDVAESESISLARWRDRPWTNRVMEWTARLGAYWL